MIQFKPYPAYKDSEVEWLSVVPDHWRPIPIKYTAIQKGSLFLDGDWIESKDISADGIRYITTGNVGEGIYKEQGAGFITEETFHHLDCTEVYEGDLLISRLNNPIGRACLVPNLGARIVTSVDNVIYRPDGKFHKKFLVYLFSSKEYFEHAGNLARGATMQRISRGLLGNIRIVIPPLEEQAQIARFLDYETARIDALIEEQQRLIELLKEKRQAVISHTVTKGLAPSVPMKDSGVEWLGEVPAHWDVKRVKDVILSFEQGWSPQCESQPVENEAQPGVLKAGCVNGGTFRWMENKKLPDDLELIPSLTVRADDLLISRANTRELVGSAAVSTATHPNLMISDKIFRIRIDESLAKPHFLSFYLGSKFARREIELAATGASSSMLNIGQGAITNMFFPCPPVGEQDSIVKNIVNETWQLLALAENAIRLKELLQERRSALISAAVTGKIDLRDWQPPTSTPTSIREQETA